jgi:hypothetical protein
MAAQLDAQARARWERLGLSTISRPQGVAILDRLAAAPVPQVGVLPIDWRRFADAFPGSTPPPFLADVVSTAAAASARPDPSARRPALIARLDGAPIRSRVSIVQGYVRDVVRQVLGVAPSHALELSQGLREMGMDSLMAVELRNHLQAGAGRALPSTIAFEHPTIGALARYLDELLEGVGMAADAAPAEIDRGADELRELSDEDAEALLAQELQK